MRWIIYGIAVFSIINAIVIAYWRDSQVDLTVTHIVFILLVLPSLVIASTYGAMKLVSYLKQKPKQDNSENSDGTIEGAEVTDEHLPFFKVYASVIQSSLGDQCDEVLEAIGHYPAAELDEELQTLENQPLLSWRVESQQTWSELSQSLNADELDIPVYLQRMTVLTAHVLEKLQSQLIHLAQGVAALKQWRTTSSIQNPVLHPAWQGAQVSDVQIEAPDAHTQTIAKMQGWPKQLIVRYFVSDKVALATAHHYEQLLKRLFQSFEFEDAYLDIQPIVLSDAVHQSEVLLSLLNTIQKDEESVYLILGADSELDQDYLDQKYVFNSQYEAGEMAYGILLSAQQVSIPETDEITQLSMLLPVSLQYSGEIQQQLQHTLGKLQKAFAIEHSNLVGEDGSVILDFCPRIDSIKLEQFSKYLPYLSLHSEQTVYGGVLLGHTSQQTAGFTLALALGVEKNEGLNDLLIFSQQKKVLLGVKTAKLNQFEQAVDDS